MSFGILKIEDQRLKKASINSIIMVGLKGLSLLISLLYVPLLLNSLSAANYGVWLTLTSFISWISLLDIGLGNGLRNRLSEAIAKEQLELAKSYVSTAYGTIIFVVLLIIIIFFSVWNFVPWYKLLGADASVDKLEFLVLFVFILFCFNFILSLLNSILNALQLPALSSLIGMIGHFVSFVVVFVLVKFYNITSLLFLGTVISVIPSIVLLVFTILLFRNKMYFISPSVRYFNLKYVKDVLSLGVKFFVIQIITIVLYQSNNVIITQTINSGAVVEYNVAYKYMNILVMFFNIIVMPMWSATTEAYTRGELYWIKQVNSKLQKIALLFSVVGFVMLCLSSVIYKIWLGTDQVVISFKTTFIMYIYAVAMMFYGLYGYLINGIGKLVIQILFTSITALLYIPSAFFMGKNFGLNGILVLYAISTIINVIWSKIQFSKIINCRASGLWNK